MYTSEALRDIHERAHRVLRKVLGHAEEMTAEEFDRELEGFAYPSVRLQVHHVLGAERYWLGVLCGRMDADDDSDEFPTAGRLEELRRTVFDATEAYLAEASGEELNTPRPMTTWGGREQELTPALVILRTQTHVFQHLGQVGPMLKTIGRPLGQLDFPIV